MTVFRIFVCFLGFWASPRLFWGLARSRPLAPLPRTAQVYHPSDRRRGRLAPLGPLETTRVSAAGFPGGTPTEPRGFSPLRIPSIISSLPPAALPPPHFYRARPAHCFLAARYLSIPRLSLSPKTPPPPPADFACLTSLFLGSPHARHDYACGVFARAAPSQPPALRRSAPHAPLQATGAGALWAGRGAGSRAGGGLYHPSRSFNFRTMGDQGLSARALLCACRLLFSSRSPHALPQTRTPTHSIWVFDQCYLLA